MSSNVSSDFQKDRPGHCQLSLKLDLVLHNAGLVTEFFAMIKTMISTTVETFTEMMISNPFVGGCKVVVEIIGIMENTLDFDNCGFRRRRTTQ